MGHYLNLLAHPVNECVVTLVAVEGTLTVLVYPNECD